MSATYKEVSQAAAFLADDSEVKERVESEILKNQLVTMMIRFRVDKGVSQKAVANAMQCDPSKISKLESGNDENLKWVDVVGYLSALGVNMNISFEDQNMSATDKIKHHVFMIHGLLEQLANLAKEVGDDRDFTDKINQFFGEVLLNFLLRFGISYEKLDAVLQFPQEALSTESAEKKNENAEETDACAACN